MDSIRELSVDELARVSGGDSEFSCLSAAQLGSQIGAGVGLVAGFLLGRSAGPLGVAVDSVLGAIGGFVVGGTVGFAVCEMWNEGAILYQRVT